MRYVFDASAIVNLVKRGTVKVLAHGGTLDLALYEALNAMWKEHRLGNIDEASAAKFAEVLGKLFDIIRVGSIRGSEKEVLALASKEGLTVYDASYLYIALKNGSTLVTDDAELREKASRHVKAVASTDIA